MKKLLDIVIPYYLDISYPDPDYCFGNGFFRLTIYLSDNLTANLKIQDLQFIETPDANPRHGRKVFEENPFKYLLLDKDGKPRERYIAVRFDNSFRGFHHTERIGFCATLLNWQEFSKKVKYEEFHCSSNYLNLYGMPFKDLQMWLDQLSLWYFNHSVPYATFLRFCVNKDKTIMWDCVLDDIGPYGSFWKESDNDFKLDVSGSSAKKLWNLSEDKFTNLFFPNLFEPCKIEAKTT